MKMNRTNTAGRILVLLLTALLVLSLAACGKKGNDDMTKPNAEPKNAQEAAAMYKALMHIPQRMHSVWLGVFVTSTSILQALAHFPQETHLFLSTFIWKRDTRLNSA